MTQEEVMERAEKIVSDNGRDYESSHDQLDKLVCELLRSLGYEDFANLFEKEARWCA